MVSGDEYEERVPQDDMNSLYDEAIDNAILGVATGEGEEQEEDG